jgi:RNA polymerase sigma-70 factor (ECF subfamily)
MNPETHKEFLSRYQPIHVQFTRYCSSNAYGLMETEDLVHETILVTLQQFNSIRNKDRLLYFMIGVAGNIVKNLLRREKFRGAFDEKAFKKLESRLPNPESALDAHYLYKALNQLPLKDKEAIVLFEINGFSVREISEIQHASEGATKTRLSRARVKLKELLTEKRPEISTYAKTQVLFSILL